MPALIDLTGKTFGRWTVNKRSGSTKDGKAAWECACECGEINVVNGGNLVRGKSLSCGCFQKERASECAIHHGLSKTIEHRIWMGMKSRCYNKKDKFYKDYGGRGIVVSDVWRNDFLRFYKDMGRRPSNEHSIDRKDVNGNYSPDNCKWSTTVEQARNRRVRKTNKSSYSGVFMRKDSSRYTAYISVNKYRMHLGTFETLDEAKSARLNAEREYW